MNNFPTTPAPEPVAAPPKPEVKTNVFAAAPPSQRPMREAPAQAVRTGSFGDVNGFPGKTSQMATLNAPQLGSFGRASRGDSTGGSNGRSSAGIVTNAGFGSGTVATSGNGETPGGGVHAGGFGDAHVGGGGNTVAQAKPSEPRTVPVEVLEKPQPQYTSEARDLKIEGEVHLKVLFQANGRVQVLQVVRGLGHGLDEAAVNAAQKIRFKPAQREGQPCDMTATIHIVFQLAS